LTFAVGGTSSEVEYWQKVLEEFTDSTGIQVTLARQPTDTDQRRQGLVIPLRAYQNDPDIFLMDVIWVNQFATAAWLEPLDSAVIKGMIDPESFFDAIVEQVDTYNDTLFALPVYNDCGLLYYRKDLLKRYKSRIPQTWHELIMTAVKIQEHERDANPHFFGFVWQGAQYEGLICNFLELTVSHNGGISDSTGRVYVHTPTNIQVAGLMRELIHGYNISPPNTYTEMKEEEARLTFENGNALFERNWPYAWCLHDRKESPVRGRVGVTVLPKGDNGKHASTLGGWHIGISRFSDAKDNALKLLQYIVSYKIQKNLALNLGWNPGRSDLYEDVDVTKKIPHLQVLKKSFENAVARPATPFYTQISGIIQKHLSAILAGKSPPSKALADAQSEIEETLRRYHD
jgi:multiple sugar transport system substrate-binding protein